MTLHRSTEEDEHNYCTGIPVKMPLVDANPLQARVDELEAALLAHWDVVNIFGNAVCNICAGWGYARASVEHKPNCIMLTISRE